MKRKKKVKTLKPGAPTGKSPKYKGSVIPVAKLGGRG